MTAKNTAKSKRDPYFLMYTLPVGFSQQFKSREITQKPNKAIIFQRLPYFCKKRKPVSRVLYPDCSGPPSFIYPFRRRNDPAAYPSRLPKNQNGQFCIPAYRKIVIYLALQRVSGTADDVATVTGELLLHLFTRSRSRHVETRWSFSVTILQAFARLPVKKYDALCCPDFPLSRFPGTAIERSAPQRWSK